jgi:hypothetical protein
VCVRARFGGEEGLQCVTSQREYAICQGWVLFFLEQLLAVSCAILRRMNYVCMNILSRKCPAVHLGYRRFDCKQDFCFIPNKLGNSG